MEASGMMMTTTIQRGMTTTKKEAPLRVLAGFHWLKLVWRRSTEVEWSNNSRARR